MSMSKRIVMMESCSRFLGHGWKRILVGGKMFMDTGN